MAAPRQSFAHGIRMGRDRGAVSSMFFVFIEPTGQWANSTPQQRFEFMADEMRYQLIHRSRPLRTADDAYPYLLTFTPHDGQMLRQRTVQRISQITGALLMGIYDRILQSNQTVELFQFRVFLFFIINKKQD
jgi:hypothetical protein